MVQNHSSLAVPRNVYDNQTLLTPAVVPAVGAHKAARKAGQTLLIIQAQVLFSAVEVQLLCKHHSQNHCLFQKLNSPWDSPSWSSRSTLEDLLLPELGCSVQSVLRYGSYENAISLAGSRKPRCSLRSYTAARGSFQPMALLPSIRQCSVWSKSPACFNNGCV